MNLETVLQVQAKLFVECLLTKEEVLSVPVERVPMWDVSGNCYSFNNGGYSTQFSSFYDFPFYHNLLDGNSLFILLIYLQSPQYLFY